MIFTRRQAPAKASSASSAAQAGRGPVPLDPEMLRHVAGGLTARAVQFAPKGTWTTFDSTRAAPKGTW
jgi:hypothetical protein